jgi:hypothetical protein
MPNSGSALGSFPGVVVVGLDTDIDNHGQNVRVHHTQSSVADCLPCFAQQLTNSQITFKFEKL